MINLVVGFTATTAIVLGVPSARKLDRHSLPESSVDDYEGVRQEGDHRDDAHFATKLVNSASSFLPDDST